MEADYLFTEAHLLTMAGDGVGYIANGAVAVRGNKIVAVGETAEVAPQVSAKVQIALPNRAILPGLIDAHMHTPLAIVRGVAQDVKNWMQAALAPYSKHLTPEASNAGTRLNVIEGMKAGTTTFGDYAFPLDGWAEIFDQFGVRACLTPRINAFPKTGMAGWKIGDLYPLDDAAAQESTDIAIRFVQERNGSAEGRITVLLGPQGPDMLTTEQLLAVKAAAQREGVMIHLHTAQGDREIDQMLLRYNMRTPEYLEEIGYLDDQLLAVHLTEATDDETEMIARSGASMALCSGSIGIIDGIVPPAYPFRQAGGLVCLGSDQASGNNCNNIFNEMKLTALFNKIKYRDPTVLPAWEVLRMATIEGAQALGMGDRIGSIEAGKLADLIFIDITEPNLVPILDQPIRTLVPNLVYAGTGREVTDVMINGRFVVKSRVIQTVDETMVRENAQIEAEKVAANVAADPVHKTMALLEPMRAGYL